MRLSKLKIGWADYNFRQNIHINNEVHISKILIPKKIAHLLIRIFFQSGTDRSSRSRLGSASDIRNENGEIDYKKLYEQAILENDRLKEKLRKSDEELRETKQTLEKLNLVVSIVKYFISKIKIASSFCVRQFFNMITKFIFRNESNFVVNKLYFKILFPSI